MAQLQQQLQLEQRVCQRGTSWGTTGCASSGAFLTFSPSAFPDPPMRIPMRLARFCMPFDSERCALLYRVSVEIAF